MKLSSTRWGKTQDWRALRATRDTCSEFGSFATSPSGAFGGQMLQTQCPTLAFPDTSPLDRATWNRKHARKVG